MRRLCATVASLCLLVGMVGCHTAGVCDCDGPDCGCGCGCGPSGAPVLGADGWNGGPIEKITSSSPIIEQSR